MTRDAAPPSAGATTQPLHPILPRTTPLTAGTPFTCVCKIPIFGLLSCAVDAISVQLCQCLEKHVVLRCNNSCGMSPCWLTCASFGPNSFRWKTASFMENNLLIFEY